MAYDEREEDASVGEPIGEEASGDEEEEGPVVEAPEEEEGYE